MGLVISILVIWITKVRKLLCSSIERTNLRQVLEVIKIIIKNIHGSLLPKGTKSKVLRVSQLALQLELSSFLSHFQSFLCFSHYLLNISPTKPNAFSRLSKNLSCVQTFESFHNSPTSAKISMCHFNLYSTNTILS